MTKKILILLAILILIGVWFFRTPKAVSANPIEFKVGVGVQEAQERYDRLLAEAKEAYRQQKLLEYKNELNTKAKKLAGTKQGQCVIAVRKFIWGEAWNSAVARSQIKGLAANLQTDSSTPEIGWIIKIETGYTDHVGTVIDIVGDELTYYHSNGAWTERAAISKIKISDKRILGYKIINLPLT